MKKKKEVPAWFSRRNTKEAKKKKKKKKNRKKKKRTAYNHSLVLLYRVGHVKGPAVFYFANNGRVLCFRHCQEDSNASTKVIMKRYLFKCMGIYSVVNSRWFNATPFPSYTTSSFLLLLYTTTLLQPYTTSFSFFFFILFCFVFSSFFSILFFIVSSHFEPSMLQCVSFLFYFFFLCTFPSRYTFPPYRISFFFKYIRTHKVYTYNESTYALKWQVREFIKVISI